MQPHDALRGLLQWSILAGADEAIGERPTDWFAVSATPQPRPAASPAPPPPEPMPEPPPPRPAPALLSRADVDEDARARVRSAATLEDLHEVFAAFDGCPLKETATNFVFADGTKGAELMLIGEAPGAEEDRQGVPFVGPAGRLLDRMLAAIGMAREEAYITNILPWRPPGNRNPTDAEVSACMPFLRRHIELVEPRIVVMVGGTAAKTLLGAREGIMKLRGRWYAYESEGLAAPVPARAIFHPAYLLRTPAHKREAWHDMLAIRHRLDELRGG